MLKDKEEKLPNYIRADGNAVCNICGLQYKDHEFWWNHTTSDGLPWLRVGCEGELFKI